MKDIKFYKLAVFVNALVPLALLAWDWARGQVGANPVDFVSSPAIRTIVSIRR